MQAVLVRSSGGGNIDIRVTLKHTVKITVNPHSSLLSLINQFKHSGFRDAPCGRVEITHALGRFSTGHLTRQLFELFNIKGYYDAAGNW
jgi:hypothetical protein